MRSLHDDDEIAPAFTLSCPGYHGPGKHAGGSASPGNLSFCISNAVIAQIDHDDLLESWQEAVLLSPEAALSISEQAADRLAETLELGLEAADLAEAVADAAVVFLLAMKRQGISDPKRIPPCTVMWNGQDHRESVLLGA